MSLLIPSPVCREDERGETLERSPYQTEQRDDTRLLAGLDNVADGPEHSRSHFTIERNIAFQVRDDRLPGDMSVDEEGRERDEENYEWE